MKIKGFKRLSLAVAVCMSLLLAACTTGDNGPTPGTLNVTVSGLPEGVAAAVNVSGPGGFSRTLSASQTLTELTPGSYTVSADEVTDGSDTYAATVSGSPATVPEGGTASVNVSYDLQEPDVEPGSLTVEISGLPSGAAADVNVTGPDGFSEPLTATTTFKGLSPGDYVVTANDVTHDGVVYDATVTGSPATVTEGGSVSAEVVYEATETTPGNLTVTISGLPSGADADVSVSGPAGFEQTLTESATLEDLAPGDYTVTAGEVTHEGDSYGATVTGSPATVAAGESASVEVSYAFLDPGAVGSLEVVVEGLPSGASADVTVSGPNGFEETLTESATLENLTPGYYTVTAENVTHEAANFAAEVTGSPALVLEDETATVTVSYQQFAEDDGDAASNPGLYAQFRNTSPGPVWVDRALFNADDPIDTKGIQYRKALSEPGNLADWIAFTLVHGESNTTITVSLECDPEPTDPSPIRAELRDEDGNKIGQTVLCGEAQDIAVPNEGGTGDYLLEIRPSFSTPFYTDYRLSIDAYCFQGCTYQPYEDN